MSPAPTPADLRTMAEWFDNPQLSPALSIPTSRVGMQTPGYLLRRIADALEAAGRRPRPSEDPVARRLPNV